MKPIKTCPRCGTRHRYSPSWCRECMKAYRKPKRYRVLRGRKRKAELISAFGGRCQRCRRKYPPFVYDFHHIDKATKSFEVNTLSCATKPFDKVKEEAMKCQLLCSNCHRIVEWGDRP